MLRAYQTAEAIAAAWSPPLAIQAEAGIGETRLPDWEGRLVDDIVVNEPSWQEFYKGPADFRFPGGETGRELQQRVVAVVERLRSRFTDGEVILVSHADPLRGLIAHYLGMEANHYYRLRIDCGSISQLSLPDPASDHRLPQARLDFLNLTEHLRAC